MKIKDMCLNVKRQTIIPNMLGDTFLLDTTIGSFWI